MDSSIGKILPVDGFIITKTGVTPKDDHSALTHLYQPILGQLPISIYQFLCSEHETSKEIQKQTHHTLMTYLSTPLDKFYDARRLLEAIGLLKTYVSKQENRVYIYEICPPFSPEEFFKDTFLSLLLQHEIGNDKFNQLKLRFQREETSLEGYEEITASFDDIFHQRLPVSMKEDMPSPQQKDKGPVKKGPIILNNRIDFNWLEEALKQRMYPSQKILSGINKKLIVQLASLYNLTTTEIERALTWAINDENELDVEEFKSACHDFMKKNKSTADVENTREKVAASSDSSLSKEEQFVQMLEQISPKELLEDVSYGNQAADGDLRMIRDVMTEQGLSPGVMNVLVHYVLLKTDMKLSKPYLEKIASHWTRKNVTTVRQAMNLAKAEHQKYQQWGRQRSSYRKQSKEVIPEWFKKQDEKREQQEQTASASIDTNEIAERIRKLSSNNNGA
ncbi:replication initiation and membrane attachment family protein [Halobacillus sp. Marseille-Q1614]|uniref:replication initiation and membrane attachment family protein n=1 Tax=Halobacillus sp. Marseille-Q1614 TaxID=2709134 RepID=UPI001570F6B4|nr:DnaD domain protein [Halobacillus sp. Marseille-Q1614]